MKIYTGIDIGTYHVKVVIAGAPERPDVPMQILGTGTASSKGLRHGYIIDQNEASRSIREAIGRASAASKVQVKSARVAVGGVSLDEVRSTAETSLSPWGGIVTDATIARLKSESEKRASNKLSNRTVLHSIPLEYRLDGTKVFGSPEGLQGTKISVDTLLVTMLTQHYDDLIAAVEKADIEVEDVMASPLAASFVTLTKHQKTAGVVLANIGAETLSIIVFDNNIPISVKMFPVGSSDITNAIALSFQIPLSEAESLKRGGVTGSDIAPKKMEAIVTARVKEMFTLVDAHLKSIGRQRLLPAGIVITGGGSGIVNANDIARAVLKLPSQIGHVGFMTRTSSVDATWAVAYGLCRWAYAEDIAETGHSLNDVIRHAWQSIKETIKNLLP
ncbi:MAG TPA: cell division FtsA domain-containing protein [Candidatus Paceibacterota bacterium]|nr:cell division FtsA domain-containing protein [Candidatus Paceibacterota bacterium]